MASGYRPGSAVGLSAETAPHLDLGAAYAVTLPGFEGPLDLLLHLIEQEQLDISEVSLVAVTDQYLRTIQQMERPAPGALADFLVVASRLLYIKSVRLLPKPPDPGDEEEDAGSALVRHLLEYRLFRRAVDALRARDGAMRVFPRPTVPLNPPVMGARAPEFGELEALSLRAALQKALVRVARVAPPPSVHPYPVTVAERMAALRQRLSTQSAQGVPRIAFAALLSEVDTRIAVVVTFLAVLELVKQGELAATQEGTFGEIWLAWQEPDDEGELPAATDGQERSAEETGPDQTEDGDEP